MFVGITLTIFQNKPFKSIFLQFFFSYLYSSIQSDNIKQYFPYPTYLSPKKHQKKKIHNFYSSLPIYNKIKFKKQKEHKFQKIFSISFNKSTMSSKQNQQQTQISLMQTRQNQLKQMKRKNSTILKQQIFRLKQQLHNMQICCQCSVGKKKQVKEEIQKNKQKYMKYTYQLQNQLKAQQQTITNLQNELNQYNAIQTQQITFLTKTHIKQQKYLQDSNTKQLTKKRQQQRLLTQKIEYIKKYPERRKKYKISLDELNIRLKKMQQQQQKNIFNIRSQHQKQRLKQQQDTQLEIKKIKDSEVLRLQEKMTIQQFTKKQNQIMQSEIKLCEQQISILQKQCTQLKKYIQYDRVQSSQNILGNQANQTYQRSLRIIKLQGKLTKLKTQFSSQIAKLTKQYQNLDPANQKQHQQLQSKISKDEGWIRIKERDLKKLKACSQMVLNQRSNLQSYLLQVFYQHPDINYKNQININTILRFLFIKINSKKPPVTYKNFLTEHSLGSSSASSNYQS